MARGRYAPGSTIMGRCPSGQREQTVNLPAYAYGGSNPSRPTRSECQPTPMATPAPQGDGVVVLFVRYSISCMTATDEPAVELAADLALDADQLEAAAGVQRPRGVAAGLDAADHRVEPRLAWRPRPAARAAPCRCRARCGPGARRPSPRRSCGRRRAPCTARARRSRPPDASRRRRRSRRTRRCAPPAIPAAARSSAGRCRTLPSSRVHLAVVDLGDRRGVGGGGEPDGDRSPADTGCWTRRQRSDRTAGREQELHARRAATPAACERCRPDTLARRSAALPRTEPS